MAMNNNSGTGGSVPALSRPFVLNPHARPFRPVYGDDNCLFLTFSNGFPLSESQIFWFFDWMYPGFVEEVYVHRPGPRRQPSLFGKIMFKNRNIPDRILGGQERVGFQIDGLPVFCRRYVPKHKMNPAATASGSTGPASGDHE